MAEQYVTTSVKRCSICRNDVAWVSDVERCCISCLLTPRQKEALDAVRKHEPCTVGEVADELHLASVSSALYLLRVLRSHGLVDWAERQHRTIHLVKAPGSNYPVKDS